MKLRTMLGVAAVIVAATVVTGFALNAFVGAPTASASGADGKMSFSGKHGGSVDKSKHHNVDVDRDHTATCKVYIEMSEVDDSSFCSPQTAGDVGAKTTTKSGGSGEWKAPPKHTTPSKPAPKPAPKVTIYEKTTCEAKGYYAVNQCNVGDDANAAIFDDGYKSTGTQEGSYQREHHRDGGSRHGGATTVYEKTECEAKGYIAINQCNVDDDANAFLLGGLGRGIDLPLVGGLLG